MNRKLKKMIETQITLRQEEEAARSTAREERELADLVDFGRCEWAPERVIPCQ
jgi:hypothetical protein